MGRKYSSNMTEALLDAVDVVEVVSDYVQLKRSGANNKGLCPFHNEKSPSFMVSEQRQLYHCFGCGVSGNAIGFIMAIENFDFLDAIEFLADKMNFDLDPFLEKQDNSNYKAPIKKDLYEATRMTAMKYYKNLRSNKSVMAYLEKRNLSDETIKKFGIGYSLDKWDDILKFLGKSNYTPKQMLEVGLIVPKKENKGYYDRFRNRVMFPIFNVKGKVIGFGGRVTDDSLPKYLNSPENDIFNKSETLYGLNFAKNEISKSRKLVVVEGYMDVISLYEFGIKNAVATLGTALTEKHGLLLKRYADEVILSYDSDEAGKKAALKGIEVLKKVGLKVKVLTLTDGMDPDDFIKKFGKDKFEEAVAGAKYYIDFKIDILQVNHDINTSEGLAEFSRGFIEILKSLKSDVEKNIYIQKVAKATGIPENRFMKDLFGEEYTAKKKYKKKKKIDTMTDTSPIVRDTKKKSSPLEKYEAQLLLIALKSSEGFDRIQDVVPIQTLTNHKVRTVFNYLKVIYGENRRFNLETAAEVLEFDILTFVNAIIKTMPPVVDINNELNRLLPNYRVEIINNRIKQLSEEEVKVLSDATLSIDERRSGYDGLKQKEMKLKTLRTELINKMKN